MSPRLEWHKPFPNEPTECLPSLPRLRVVVLVVILAFVGVLLVLGWDAGAAVGTVTAIGLAAAEIARRAVDGPNPVSARVFRMRGTGW
jgi:hypothetical protein